MIQSGTKTAHHAARRGLGMVLASLLIGACGGTTELPTAGDNRGFVPDLRERTVMVLPVQINAGIPGDLDREIEFALQERGPGVGWSFPDELRGALERNPMVDGSVRGLPVAVFLQAEVDRVGDPLYGQLRRMGALVDSDLALVPVQARMASVNAAGETGLELSVALIEIRTGRLYWYGVVGGRPGAAGDFATVASAAEALAERLLWFAR